MYYGQSMTDDAGYGYEEEQEYDRGDRDWRRERRHRSRSPLIRGSSRRERSRSRERDRFDDRYENDSSYHLDREDYRHQEYEDSSMSSMPTSIEYHHGLSEQKTPLLSRPGLLDQRNIPRTDRYQRETPSQTVFLGGVPRFIEEQDIRAELDEAAVDYSDVRMVRHKDTGANRGFAFVEFRSIDDARRWMDLNQGLLKVRDAYGVPHTVTMDYSKAANPPSRAPPPPHRPPPPLMRQGRPPEITEWRINDWKCVRCGCDNFRRRENCFQCNIPRSEGERQKPKDDDGGDQVGSNPCNTLLLRGLDALTAEPSIVNSLAVVTDIKPKNVCVVRNHLTGLSRGYALVECTNIRDSILILDTVRHLESPFEVDGKAIIVSYAKNTYSTYMAYLSQQSSQHSGYSDQPEAGNYSSRSGPSSRPGPLRRVADPSNAAEVAEAALMASRLHQQENSDSGNNGASQSTSQTNVVTPPDVNTFVFDEASGYYYDANTGYYYDANTQYFYNPQTSQFLYWDSSAQSYLPAPTNTESGENTSSAALANSGTINGTEASASATPSTAAEQSAEKEKAERAKQAKKIIKDMERWAKVQNAHKESGGGFKKPLVPFQTKKESATADAGFAAISKASKSDKFTIELMRSREDRRPFGKLTDESKLSKAQATQLVASYGGDSESEEESEEPQPPPSSAKTEELNLSTAEARMTDWDKLTCLLCKRLFNTKEALQRHQQLSDLHKTNLEEYKKSLMASKGR